MGQRADHAKELFTSGCNCAQAVLTAFSDLTGLDKETALKLAEPFGAGLGRMREVCGTVSGMSMVLGLLYGSNDVSDMQQKGDMYALIQRVAGEFEKKNGAIVCRTLLGFGQGKDSPTPEARTAAYYKKRPCAEYVYDAASIIESILEENAGNADKD